VRVLTLADTLQVTRGSFYWHFKDHATLIEALVERWEARELEAHQRLEQAGSEDPAKALEIMLDQALAHGGDALDDMRFELALRALGRRDAHVAAVMRKMDALRIALFKRKFMPLVQDEKTAAELATLFYLSVVGSFHALIQPHMPSASKQFFLDIIAKYLVQKQRR
jgi:AcrR family transcriptional regulator